MVKDVDYVECPICGKQGKRIYKHIIGVHNLSIDDFRNQYPGCETTCLSLRKQIQQNTTKSLNTEDVKRRRTEYLNSEAGKARQRAGMQAIQNRPDVQEARIKSVKKALKRRWEDPIEREKVSKNIKKSLTTDEMCQRRHQWMVERWNNPDYREKEMQNVMKQFSDGNLGVRKTFIDDDGKEVVFRSSWEFEFYKILKSLGIDFEYEAHKFFYKYEGITKIYIPDFYIKSLDLFIEIKPYYYQEYEINKIKVQSVVDKGKKIICLGDNEYNNVEYIKSLLCSE